MGFRLGDFSMDLRKCTAPWKYIWVNSGFSTCALRKETVTGAQGLYAPPFAAPDTALSFSLEADGHSIEDTGNKGKGDCGLLFAGEHGSRTGSRARAPTTSGRSRGCSPWRWRASSSR